MASSVRGVLQPACRHTSMWPACRSEFACVPSLQADRLAIRRCKVEVWSTDLAALAKFKDVVRSQGWARYRAVSQGQDT